MARCFPYIQLLVFKPGKGERGAESPHEKVTEGEGPFVRLLFCDPTHHGSSNKETGRKAIAPYDLKFYDLIRSEFGHSAIGEPNIDVHEAAE